MFANKKTKKAKCIYIRKKFLQIKCKGCLIEKLKAIKSRKDIFCYLSFYLHCGLF